MRRSGKLQYYVAQLGRAITATYANLEHSGSSQHAQIWPNCIATSTEEDTHRGRSQVSRIKGGCCPPRAALRVKAVPRVVASRTNIVQPTCFESRHASLHLDRADVITIPDASRGPHLGGRVTVQVQLARAVVTVTTAAVDGRAIDLHAGHFRVVVPGGITAWRAA